MHRIVTRSVKNYSQIVTASEISEVTDFLAKNYWNVNAGEPIGTLTHKPVSSSGQFFYDKSIIHFIEHGMERQSDCFRIIRGEKSGKIKAFGSFSVETLPLDPVKMRYLWLNDVNFQLIQRLGLFEILNEKMCQEKEILGKQFIYLGILCLEKSIIGGGSGIKHCNKIAYDIMKEYLSREEVIGACGMTTWEASQALMLGWNNYMKDLELDFGVISEVRYDEFKLANGKFPLARHVNESFTTAKLIGQY